MTTKSLASLQRRGIKKARPKLKTRSLDQIEAVNRKAEQRSLKGEKPKSNARIGKQPLGSLGPSSLDAVYAIALHLKELDALKHDDEIHAREAHFMAASLADTYEVFGWKHDRPAFIQLARREKNFRHALETGGSHPLLARWQKLRMQGHPTNSILIDELHAVAAQASIALQAAHPKMEPGDARNYVADLVCRHTSTGSTTGPTVGSWERALLAAEPATCAEVKSYGTRSSRAEVEKRARILIQQTNRPVSKWEGDAADPDIANARQALLDDALAVVRKSLKVT